jgi:hypothetical protein
MTPCPLYYSLPRRIKSVQMVPNCIDGGLRTVQHADLQENIANMRFYRLHPYTQMVCNLLITFARSNAFQNVAFPLRKLFPRARFILALQLPNQPSLNLSIQYRDAFGGRFNGLHHLFRGARLQQLAEGTSTNGLDHHFVIQESRRGTPRPRPSTRPSLLRRTPSA